MSDKEKLSIELIDQEGIPVVHVRGEIDLYTVPEFEQAVQEGINRGGLALVVDLSDVPYLDSAGLSVLFAAYKALSARNAMLYVVAHLGQPGVCRVLEITRLDTLIRVRGTVEDVIKELQTAGVSG